MFSDLTPFSDQIHPLFQHIRYYFPREKDPKIVLLTNNVDYQNKTVYTDSLVLISLDTFLGAKRTLCMKAFPSTLFVIWTSLIWEPTWQMVCFDGSARTARQNLAGANGSLREKILHQRSFVA